MSLGYDDSCHTYTPQPKKKSLSSPRFSLVKHMLFNYQFILMYYPGVGVGVGVGAWVCGQMGGGVGQ